MVEIQEIKKLSDVLPKQEPLYPDLVQVEAGKTINKEVVLKEMNFLPSGYGGEFIVAKIELEGNDFSISYGGKAVVEKLKKVEDKLPVKMTLVQKKSLESGRVYYDVE